MVETDHDNHGVVVAQKASEEQVQDLRVYLPAKRVHLLARFFSCASQRIF